MHYGIQLYSVRDLTQSQGILETLRYVAAIGYKSVEFAGFGSASAAEIRAELDRVNPECHLEVDGGVDLVTGEICKANGADVLVAGSAFYKAEDKRAFREAIEA